MMEQIKYIHKKIYKIMNDKLNKQYWKNLKGINFKSHRIKILHLSEMEIHNS